jgi:hypothetical protein
MNSTPLAEDPPALVKAAAASMAAAPSYRTRGWLSSALLGMTPTPINSELVKGTPWLEGERSGTNSHVRIGSEVT